LTIGAARAREGVAISTSLLLIDLGDVLIRTVPGGHHRQLARQCGLPAAEVADRLAGSGLPAAFDTGRLNTAQFAAAVCRLLGGRLTPAAVTGAWRRVIGQPDAQMVAAVAPLARAGHVVLASNTDPLHWTVVRRRLQQAGLAAPAALSFRIGRAKPDPAFFRHVTAHFLRGRHAVFVDDRPENVAAATATGLSGWVHLAAAASIDRIAALGTGG
jgi:FMN phosphatase YigB (HAD superfamily)